MHLRGAVSNPHAVYDSIESWVSILGNLTPRGKSSAAMLQFGGGRG